MGIDSRYFAILLAIILILVIFLIVFVIKRVQKKNKVYKEATEEGNLEEITRKYKADIKDMLTNIENQIGDVGELEKLSKDCTNQACKWSGYAIFALLFIEGNKRAEGKKRSYNSKCREYRWKLWLSSSLWHL